MTDSILVKVDSDLEPIIYNYINNQKKEIAEIRTLIQENNYDEIIRKGHNLKGTGGGYDLPLITEYGREIESAAKNQDKDKILNNVDLLENFLNFVKIEFK